MRSNGKTYGLFKNIIDNHKMENLNLVFSNYSELIRWFNYTKFQLEYMPIKINYTKKEIEFSNETKWKFILYNQLPGHRGQTIYQDYIGFVYEKERTL